MRARILLPALGALALAAMAQQPSANTIHVSATGRFQAAPDTAVLEFQVSGQDKDEKKAYALAQTQAEAIRGLLRGQGIAPEQAQLGGYTVQPNFDWRSHRVTDYTVSATLRLELSDFAKVGPLIDASGAAGSASLRSLSYQLKDMTAAKTAAIADGYAQCHGQAQALAAAAGVELAGLEDASVDMADNPVIRPMAMTAQLAGVAAPPPTEDFTPHPVTVTARVAAVYRIKP